MEGKEKTNTAQLKRISAGIDASRKNIESDSNLIDNLRTIKTSFNDLEVVIKGQTPAFESMKAFSKEISSESSKNLQMKRYFNALCEKVRQDLRDYLEVVK